MFEFGFGYHLITIYMAYGYVNIFRTTTLQDDPSFLKPTCLSCNEGEECQWLGASLSPSAEYFLMNCLGPGVPTYTLMSVIEGVCKFI